MAHGIKIYNESGYTQIDQDFRNHEIVEQGTLYIPTGGVGFDIYSGYKQVNPLAMLFVQNDSESDYVSLSGGYITAVREGPVLVGEVSGSDSPPITISWRIAIPAQSSYGWTTSWTTQQSTTTSWTTGNSTSVSTSISTATGLSTSVSTNINTNTSWTTSQSTSQSTTTSWTTTVNTIVGGTDGSYTTTWNTSRSTTTSWTTSNSTSINTTTTWSTLASTSQSTGIGASTSISTSINTTTTWSTLASTSQSTAAGASTSVSTSISTNTSWTTSWNTSRSTTTSWNTSQNTSILENSGNYYSRTSPEYYVYETIGANGGWGILWNGAVIGGDNGAGGSLPASFTSGEYTYYKTGSALDPVYDAKNNVTTNYYTVYRTRTTTASTSWSTNISTTTSWTASQSTSRSTTTSWTTTWSSGSNITTTWSTYKNTSISTATSWTTTWSSGSNITTTWSTYKNTSISTATSWTTSWNTSISTTTGWNTSQSTYGTVPLNYSYSVATPYYHVEVASYDLWYWNNVAVYNAPASGLTSVTVGNYTYTRGPLQTSSFVKGTTYFYYSIARQETVATSWTTSISTTTTWTTSWNTNRSTNTSWATTWTTGQSTVTSWTTTWTTGFNTSQSTTTTWTTSITTGSSPSTTGGYGIKIFNPTGEPVFDSNKKYVKFHEQVSLNRATSGNNPSVYQNLAVANYTPTPSIPWIEIGSISGTSLYFEVRGDPLQGAYVIFAFAGVKTQNSLGVAKLRYVGGTPNYLGGYFTELYDGTLSQVLFSRD